MKKLLKHMRLIYLIFLILGGVALLSALPFKTQYNMVYVNVDQAGITESNANSTNAENQDQQLLYEYFEKDTNFDYLDKDGNKVDKDATSAIKPKFDAYKETVYNFEQNLNTTNYLILYFGIVMIVGIGILYLLQNPFRKIYYGSNVAGTVIIGLGIIAFAVVVLLKLFNLMSDLGSNTNTQLYNVVALLQNPNTRATVYQSGYTAADFTVNSATLVAYMIGMIVCIAYTLFVMVLTFAKFKRTKERRAEIISKAVENND